VIRRPHTPPFALRDKGRTRNRGNITAMRLTGSPTAQAVYADILDRFRQHEQEGTLPRGGRGIFYDLRPSGMAGNPRGLTYRKRTEADKGLNFAKDGIVTPEYVTERLAELRKLLVDDKPVIPEEWISDGRMPAPVAPYEFADADEFADQVEAAIDAARLHRQAGQPVYLQASGISFVRYRMRPDRGWDGLIIASGRTHLPDLFTDAMILADHRRSCRALGEMVIERVTDRLANEHRKGGMTDKY
jgi:hypothetical protein